MQLKRGFFQIAAIVTFVLLAIGILVFFVVKQKTSTPTNDSINLTPKTVSPTISDSTPVSTSTNYVSFSENTLEQFSERRRVLFFFANWCPTCIPADKDFQNNIDKLPTDVVVIRVNYKDNETDEGEKELAQRYGITYQHTFVQINESGDETAKWNGGSVSELLTNIK